MLTFIATALLLTASPLPAVSPALLDQSAGTACETTAPNGRAVSDDARVRAGMPASPMYFGNDSLATMLWPDGTVVFRPGGPGSVLADGALRMKFIWVKRPGASLTIEGTRLDAPAPPLRSTIQEGFEGESFQPSSLIFPSPGCWRVTARAGGSSLTFVTRVRSEIPR
jgi:hypothetical protein